MAKDMRGMSHNGHNLPFNDQRNMPLERLEY
jgi:hypothetical protein